MYTDEHGRSMMEMFGVLVVMGLISVGGMAGFTKMQRQARTNETVMQIKTMASKLSALGAKTSSYSGLTQDSLKKLGIAPSEDMQNPFGGEILVRPSKLLNTGNDEQAFVIVYTGLPQDVCIQLAGFDWTDVRSTNLLGVAVASGSEFVGDTQAISAIYQNCTGAANTQYAAGCVGSSSHPVPIDFNTAAAACNCPAENCALAVKYF